ncbi:MAG: response regulator [Woeseiaceae bacterium]|nr:response regulator [Woeseiaceae bacterium]
MTELVLNTTILIAAAVVLVAIWRVRPATLIRRREARNRAASDADKSVDRSDELAARFVERGGHSHHDLTAQRPSDPAPTGCERILVVEDNASVRRVARELLKSLNYEVLEADSGPSALDLMRRGEDFDLLFTDLVMPGGLTGIELAESMRNDRPGLKVLFTSGYGGTENGLQTPANESVLHKPYLKGALARTVRRTLDR